MKKLKSLIYKSRQPVSGYTHLLGALCALAGLCWLVFLSLQERSSLWTMLAVFIFCGSQVLLFLSSSAYHLLPLSDQGLRKLRKLDHSMIYLYIAGSYTPVCLVSFRESWGWSVFGIVWFLAVAGVLVKIFYIENSRWLRVSLYTGLSFISVFIVPSILKILPASGVVLLFSGAGAYFLGSIVYATKRPDPIPNIFGFHEIWHLFVLCGVSCHFWMMKEFILKL